MRKLKTGQRKFDSSKRNFTFWGTISEFFSNFPHYSVIKVDQIELTKIDETDMTFMQSTDTGDGIAVICSDLQIQEETKKIFG